MPGIRETRRLPYSCEEMFDLVADVGRYGEFLPWVVATRVKSDSETEMVADMLVGFKALREKFTSRVVKQRPQRLEVIYVDGPMRDLDNIWRFVPRAEGGCDIDFCVDFAFKNKMFEMLAGSYFDRAFQDGAGEEQARFDGYTTVDASLSAALGASTITFAVSNLLDEQYITYFGQAATDLADRYFAGRGRTLTLRFATHF